MGSAQSRSESTPSVAVGKVSLPLLLVTLAAAALVYFPVTRVFFWADDFSMFAQLEDRGLAYFVLHPSAGHLYLFRNLVFSVPLAIFGFHPEPYGWLALVTHLLNVALLFRFVERLTESATLGAFAGCLWGTCLLQSATLGWFAAYGHALAGTMALLALNWTVSRAAKSEDRWWAIRAAVALWIGAACFGVGVAVALVFPAVAVLLVPGALRDKRFRGALIVGLPVLTLATYYGTPKLFELIFGHMSLGDRLVADVIGTPLRTLALLGELLRTGVEGLFTSFAFVPEKDPVSPPGWPVWLFAASVLAALVAGRPSSRRAVLAMLLMATAAYGIVALARSGLYPDALTGARTARYHYVGTLPLAVLAAMIVGELANRLRRKGAPPALALALWAGLALCTHGTTGWKLEEHPACRQAVSTVLRRIEQGIDSQPSGAVVRLPNPPVPDCFIYPEFVPGAAGLFVIAHSSDEVRGRRVRFVAASAKDDEWFSSSADSRFAALLEPPPEATAPPPAPPVGNARCRAFMDRHEEVRRRLGCASNADTYAMVCASFLTALQCNDHDWELAQSTIDSHSWCDANGRLGFDVGRVAKKVRELASCKVPP